MTFIFFVTNDVSYAREQTYIHTDCLWWFWAALVHTFRYLPLCRRIVPENVPLGHTWVQQSPSLDFRREIGTTETEESASHSTSTYWHSAMAILHSPLAFKSLSCSLLALLAIAVNQRQPEARLRTRYTSTSHVSSNVTARVVHAHAL